VRAMWRKALRADTMAHRNVRQAHDGFRCAQPILRALRTASLAAMK
jgi:hypothetical protein